MDQSRKKIVDSLLQLKDAGAITADAAATVGGSAQVLDMGGGHLGDNAKVVIDISAAEVDTGNELYEIKVQGTNTAAFGGTDIVDLIVIRLGDAAVLAGASDLTTGRYVIPFSLTQGDTTYRYIRAYTDVTGTTPSINYTAFVSK